MIFWVALFFAFAEPTTSLIARVTVTGNRVLSTAEVVEVAGLKPGLPYDRGVLDRGLQRLLEAYVNAGRPWAAILPPVVRMSPDSSAVEIALRVTEGPPAAVERVSLAGSRVWAADELLADFDTRPGKGFSAAAFEGDIERLLRRYEAHGYPYCRVEVTDIQTHEGRLTVALAVVEGPLIRVDGIQVHGNRLTKAHVITRELRIRPGEPFDQRKLDRGRERLERLGLFAKVTEPLLQVNPAGDGGTILLGVEEGRTSALDGVIGYAPGGSGQKGYVTGMFSLSLRNMAGTGRRVDAAWTRRDPLSSDLRLRYEEPWVLGSPLTAGIEFDQTNQDSTYTATRVSTGVTLPLSDRLNGQFRLGWRRVIPDSLSATRLAGNREYTAGLGLTFDTRDNVLNPRRGLWASLEAEYGFRRNQTSPSFSPERARVQTSTVHVHLERIVPVLRDQVVALGVHGVDVRSGETVLPVSQQFLFGGTQTLRGYRENEFRGSQVAWSNLEYRFLLSSRSRFFVFLDTGYFSLKRRVSGAVERVNETKTGYGLGIRLQSSLGILGIDYGIGEDDALLNGKLHIGIRNEF